MEFLTVAPIKEFADGEAKLVSIGEKAIAVFRRGDEFFAFEDECPHRGASLAQGQVCDIAITCPLHGWQFDLTTGESFTRPGYRVEVFEVRIEDGLVKIAISNSHPASSE